MPKHRRRRLRLEFVASLHWKGVNFFWGENKSGTPEQWSRVLLPRGGKNNYNLLVHALPLFVVSFLPSGSKSFMSSSQASNSLTHSTAHLAGHQRSLCAAAEWWSSEEVLYVDLSRNDNLERLLKWQQSAASLGFSPEEVRTILPLMVHALPPFLSFVCPGPKSVYVSFVAICPSVLLHGQPGRADRSRHTAVARWSSVMMHQTPGCIFFELLTMKRLCMYLFYLKFWRRCKSTDVMFFEKIWDFFPLSSAALNW